jgi:hypothetical protein
MSEIWLRSNRRIAAAVAVAAGFAAITCGVVALGWIQPLHDPVVRVVAAVVGGLAILLLAVCVELARQPRVAFRDGYLLVYLGRRAPYAIPIELVEAFLVGQGPSWLAGKKHRRTETTTLVVRLADRAVDWQNREVQPVLGSWCDGYITIRGTWCEPLSLELVNRLNHRLYEVTRAAKHREAVGQRA